MTPNCRACRYCFMEPDSDFCCGHPDAGEVGQYIRRAAAPDGHCGPDRPKFEQHPYRTQEGGLRSTEIPKEDANALAFALEREAHRDARTSEDFLNFPEYGNLPQSHPEWVALLATTKAAFMSMLPEMPPPRLSVAAEFLGKNTDGPDAIAYLIQLLNHPKTYVREGALYGLASHLHNSSVQAAIQHLIETDPTELRHIAAEILEDKP